MEPEPASDEGPPLNSGREFLPSTVKAADAGAALVGFLLAHWPHDDEAHWEAKVRAGCVAIDGAACADPGATLALNSRVVYTRPPWREPPVPSRWGVAFEDGDVVVLDKPEGMPVMPSETFFEGTVMRRLARLYPKESLPAPAHRLGRGTSGCLLCARTPAARRGVGKQFQEGSVGKLYLAEVAGSPDAWPEGRLTVTAPIGMVAYDEGWVSATGGVRSGVTKSGGGGGKAGRSGATGIWAASESGKPSVSHLRFVRATAKGSLLEVRIETGRPHQIRIHAAFVGFPLVGDPLYAKGGVPKPRASDGTLALATDCGYRLHCWRLTWRHPSTGEQLVTEAPPPAWAS